jgi:hypothetical protein
MATINNNNANLLLRNEIENGGIVKNLEKNDSLTYDKEIIIKNIEEEITSFKFYPNKNLVNIVKIPKFSTLYNDLIKLY